MVCKMSCNFLDIVETTRLDFIGGDRWGEKRYYGIKINTVRY